MEAQGINGRVRAVFSPSTKEMYPGALPSSEPNASGSFVSITPMSLVLEGKSRPTFFRGVTTVVLKLLNLVQPDYVWFGQKDIQQALIIRRMIQDFHVPVDMSIVPTKRVEPSGLALSSRNVYLGHRRLQVAPVLSRALKAAQEAYNNGARDRHTIRNAALGLIEAEQANQESLPPSQRARFTLDYLSVANPDDLRELPMIGRKVVLSGAIVMQPIEEPQPDEVLGTGNDESPVRLIDNIIIGLNARLKDLRTNSKRKETAVGKMPVEEVAVEKVAVGSSLTQ
jgi:pantoate--beta-alanine ligase